MNETVRRAAYWAPRVLCICFAAFLAIFALDVFGMPGSFGQKLLGFAIHLIPTWIVLLVLAVVWRREWIAVLLFPALAVVHLVSKWGRLDWSGYALIEGPLVVLAVLFLFSWRNRVAQRQGARSASC